MYKRHIYILIILSLLFVESVSAQIVEIKTANELAKYGDPNAHELLGECYYKGFLVEKNYRKAYEHFKTAAEKEQAKAMFYLFQCYTHGRGVVENQENALIWLRKAAIAGNDDAFNEYTARYPDKRNDILDLQKKWVEERALSPEIKTLSFTVKHVTFRMVLVEGGTFSMNTKNTTVSVDDYYIGQTEVTQDLWLAVMGKEPPYFRGGARKPVKSVSLKDCKKFISKLNKLTGQNFRLPTNEEWEYAARGGKYSRNYPFSGSFSVDEVAWCEANCVSSNDVATKKPNELGIYDMSGNVDEILDTAQYRGGSYYGVIDWCLVNQAARTTLPKRGLFWVGFRLALSQL